MGSEPEWQPQREGKSSMRAVQRAEKSSALKQAPDRLKKRKDFLRVAAIKQGVVRQCTIIGWRDSAQETTRIGLTASKRIGNAVVRNKVKRRFRAIIQSIAKEKGTFFMPHTDYVLIAKNSAATVAYQTLYTEIEQSLRHIQKKRTYHYTTGNTHV